MSVVLCLPAHLCVSPQRPVAGPPRERVTMSAFIQPDGSMNPIFRTYRVENNEGQLLTRAKTMSQRKKRN